MRSFPAVFPHTGRYKQKRYYCTRAEAGSKATEDNMNDDPDLKDLAQTLAKSLDEILRLSEKDSHQTSDGYRNRQIFEIARDALNSDGAGKLVPGRQSIAPGPAGFLVEPEDDF